MGFNLWKWFGMEKKAAPDTTAYTQAVRPYQSLTEIPVGKSLNDIILAGLKGQGVGFPGQYVERATNPYIQSREARFREEELPFISGELSSRGMARSTLAGDVLSKAAGQKERDINELLSNAYMQNEAQKKLDEARYQQLGMGWTGAEAAQKGIYAAEDAARMKYATEAENKYKAEKEEERITNLNRTIATALAFMKGGTTGEGGVADVWNTYTVGNKTAPTDKWEEALKRANNTQVNESSPFTKKSLPFQSSYNFFKNMRWQ